MWRMKLKALVSVVRRAAAALRTMASAPAGSTNLTGHMYEFRVTSCHVLANCCTASRPQTCTVYASDILLYLFYLCGVES